MHGKVPQGVVVDLKNVQHETNNKNTLKKPFFTRQVRFLLASRCGENPTAPGLL